MLSAQGTEISAIEESKVRFTGVDPRSVVEPISNMTQEYEIEGVPVFLTFQVVDKDIPPLLSLDPMEEWRTHLHLGTTPPT